MCRLRVSDQTDHRHYSILKETKAKGRDKDKHVIENSEYMQCLVAHTNETNQRNRLSRFSCPICL